MRIWWCQEHESPSKRVDQCMFTEMGGPGIGHCRLVPMRLIPDNGETRHGWWIEREDGKRIEGPFSTQTDANRARYWMEKVLKPETFWIREHALDGETP